MSIFTGWECDCGSSCPCCCVCDTDEWLRKAEEGIARMQEQIKKEMDEEGKSDA